MKVASMLAVSRDTKDWCFRMTKKHFDCTIYHTVLAKSAIKDAIISS